MHHQPPTPHQHPKLLSLGNKLVDTDAGMLQIESHHIGLYGVAQPPTMTIPQRGNFPRPVVQAFSLPLRKVSLTATRAAAVTTPACRRPPPGLGTTRR